MVESAGSEKGIFSPLGNMATISVGFKPQKWKILLSIMVTLLGWYDAT